MPRPIVVGVDGTPDSLTAADWAAREARLRGLPLALVHAHTAQALAGGAEQQQRAAQDLVEDALARVRARHADVEVSAESVAGSTVGLLTARAEGAQSLVLGSRRPGPVAGFLLGSVGLRVLGRAPCPVVMVRGAAEDDGRAAADTGEVVVGVQETGAAADDVLAYAFEAAAARGAPLRAVRSWSLPTLFTYRPGALHLTDEYGGPQEAQRAQLAATLAPWRERHPRVPVVEQVELGAASEVLVTSSAGARLLVVGRRVESGRRYVGHVAHAALHFAAATVALVPVG
ncbi:universal stress protein [Streptomyces sp. NPDC059740]|uniref:universal stress protein n=1 Tax=Streptomyces sp. NPDC059740 TaxID=3346926 RepID=UPI00365C374D